MTDRELLELAAKAAGIVNEGWVQDNWRCGLFLPTHVRVEALRQVWQARDAEVAELVAALRDCQPWAAIASGELGRRIDALLAKYDAMETEKRDE